MLIQRSSVINTRYNFRRDTPPGKDPDRWSPMLRRYHKALWSRELPNGKILALRDDIPGVYLGHQSDLGSFSLSSDAIVPTYFNWKRMEPIVSQSPPIRTLMIQRQVSTIGGRMIWPSNNVAGAGTINTRRGFSREIADRIDLTLECIRRHYSGKRSPLSPVLDPNSAFFELFEDFRQFAEFFLFQDLLSSDRESIKFMLPFNGFGMSGLPNDLDQYMTYMGNAHSFVKARNKRIAALPLSAAG